jgi:tRNA pseudouridine38-40 synthase
MRKRNIALTLAYDGTGYAGWQRQKEDRTIQGVIEEKLAVMTCSTPVLHGAGRTDAGVHALGMVANFHTECRIAVDGFIKGLNSLLPDDIRVLAAREAPLEFHARRSATGKSYTYHLHAAVIQMPTDRLYAAHVKGPLDAAAVREGLGLLVGEHDFSSFEASGSRDPDFEGGRGAVRRIFSAEFLQKSKNPDDFQFSIAGDGFLRHMVRNIVGTLIELGQGKISVNGLRDILLAKDRTAAGPTAPAKGLFLANVFYD